MFDPGHGIPTRAPFAFPNLSLNPKSQTDFPMSSASPHSIPARFRSDLRRSLPFVASLSCLSISVRADVTLRVDSPGAIESFAGTVRIITVDAGAPLTFSWTATADMTALSRTWGNYTPLSNPAPAVANYATLLPAAAGSEKVRAPVPATLTSYQFEISGYNATPTRQAATVQVNVRPLAIPPAFTPIAWTLPLGTFSWVTGNGVVGVNQTMTNPLVPDAQVGVPYSTTLVATGREPITYGAVDLPAGLTLTGNTISGTPTDAAFNKNQFTITATDADGFMSPAIARMKAPVLYPRVQVPHQAPVVFDMGAPGLNGGYANDAASFERGRVAAGFKVEAATTITRVRLWGCYVATGRPDQADSFTLRFYDRGPSPIAFWPDFPAVGKLIGTFTPTSVTRATTGRAAFGIPNGEYVYDLSFAGLPVQANTLYFITVENTSKAGDWLWLDVDPAFYQTPYQNYPGWGFFSTDGGKTWPGGALDVAFQLGEGPAAPPPPPPPPDNSLSGYFKLDAKTNGKGAIALSPSARSYAPGTVVTLTAQLDLTAVWKGWTGDVVSSSRTITVTVTRDTKVTANFR